MNNYINIRIQSAKPSAIKHNFRTHNTKSSLNQREDATTPNKIVQLHSCDIDTQADKYKISEITDKNIKTILTFQNNILKKDTKLYKQLYKKRTKRNPKNSFNAHAEGVLTFSEAIDKDLGKKYSLTQLAKTALDTIKDTCKRLGTTMIQDSLVFHFDETRVHAHFKMKNFDKEGRSITHKNKTTKILSSLQDIAYKHFSKLGMDRGIKKSTSLVKHNHQSTKKYYEKEISKLSHEKESYKQELKQLKDTLQSQKLQNKQSVAELKELRVEITKLNQEKSLSQDSVKELYKEISSLQTQLRDTNKKLTQSQKELKTKQDALEIVTDLKVDDDAAKTFQKKLYKYMLHDAEFLAKVSPSSKLLYNFMSTIFEDDEYRYSMDYKFTTKELKEFIKTITLYATKVSHKPHGRYQRELQTTIESLQQMIEDKKEYIQPKLYKNLQTQLSNEITLNDTLEERYNKLSTELTQVKNNHKSTLEFKDTKLQEQKKLLQNQTTIIADKNATLIDAKEKVDTLSLKVKTLQSQKKRLFKRVREKLYPIKEQGLESSHLFGEIK